MHQVAHRVPPSQPLPYMPHSAREEVASGHRGDLARLRAITNPSHRQIWYRAAFVGVSYFGQRRPILGAANDARRLASIFQSIYAHPQEDSIILADDFMRRSSQPTRQLVLKAFEWLLAGATPGDNVFFYYSGHTNTQDALFPVDFHQNGAIDISELESRVSVLPSGVRVILVIDSIWDSVGLKEMVKELSRTVPCYPIHLP